MKKLNVKRKVIITSALRQKLGIILLSIVVGLNLAFANANLLEQHLATSAVQFLITYAMLLLVLNVVEEKWEKEIFRNLRYFLSASMLGVGIEMLVHMTTMMILTADVIIVASVLLVFLFSKSETTKASEKYPVSDKFVE